MKSFFLLASLIIAHGAQAQQYKVSTTQSDSFSVAIVKLLNAAVSRFSDCKGDSIRTTSLMGEDRQLGFHFPGSTIGIVRTRDGDVNAYIEFRGFANKKSRDEGIRALVQKIKTALGEQLYDPNEQKDNSEIYFYGLSVKDTNGYFSMNMELFGGSSSAPVYLLGPEREEEGPTKEDFILLKIYPGIPYYQYYIKPVPAPNIELDKTLRELLVASHQDFETLRTSTTSIPARRKKADTLSMNGYEVVVNYRGANYSANLYFPAATDSSAFQRQWLFYQQALQAALGTKYVFGFSSMDELPSAIYYPGYYTGENLPRTHLRLYKEGGTQLLHVRIESNVAHPTKRGMDRDDL